MKQIVVNVDGLTIEEKKRVSEALTKIKNKSSTPKVTNLRELKWFYADSQIAWSYGDQAWFGLPATHTPQQVLEIAGMAPAAEQTILADMLIITDSSGNIVYDSTVHALNRVIEQRANSGKGVSVKLDKNGAAVMVEKRKVRKDFDPAKEYSVDVSKCTEAEKKEVQQAFFDVGILWVGSGAEYQHLDRVQYTNTTGCGQVTTDCMFGNTTEDCNITSREFLDMVYEPEQEGHRHSELMAQYAEDAKTSKTPWRLWEYLSKDEGWITFRGAPGWYETSVYRRKQKTHTVNGVEIPDLRVKPKEGNYYYLANPASRSLFTHHKYAGDSLDKIWFERGLTYQPTEEGKQAVILHSMAMLNMVQ